MSGTSIIAKIFISLSNAYIMVFISLRGDNPLAEARWLSPSTYRKKNMVHVLLFKTLALV